MGWMTYYRLLEKYDGDLAKAKARELQFASDDNPNDPVRAREIAEQKYKDNPRLNEI